MTPTRNAIKERDERRGAVVAAAGAARRRDEPAAAPGAAAGVLLEVHVLVLVHAAEHVPRGLEPPPPAASSRALRSAPLTCRNAPAARDHGLGCIAPADIVGVGVSEGKGGGS